MTANNGDYLDTLARFVAETRLEDLAGNSPVRVFDRDMTEPDDGPPVDESLAVEFTCVVG